MSEAIPNQEKTPSLGTIRETYNTLNEDTLKALDYGLNSAGVPEDSVIDWSEIALEGLEGEEYTEKAQEIQGVIEEAVAVGLEEGESNSEKEKQLHELGKTLAKAIS